MLRELEIIQHRRLDGISIFFDTVDTRTPHFHPEWELLWIRDGVLSVDCEQRTCLVREGDLILFSPNQPHEFHKESDRCTFLCLQVAGDLLFPDRQVVCDSMFPAEYLDPAPVRQRLREIMDAYLNRTGQYELYCRGEVCLLFHALLSAMPNHILTGEERSRIRRRSARLDALIRFVDENYMHKIRLSDFAEAEGCSMTHLSHFIKDTLNQTFQEYVTSVRVHCACRLIASGENRMLDVCEMSGFSDYRYFSNAFKKQFGMTPEQYRSAQVRPESAAVVHSLHSLERFYDDEESRQLLAGMPG